MEVLTKDLRFAWRMLGRKPGFTAIAILTLALGIGANTAIFSVLDAVLLRPLPYPDSQRIVTVWGRFRGIGIPDDQNYISAPEFNDLQNLPRSFSAIAAIDEVSFNLGASGQPERVSGAPVSPGFFDVLGIQPIMGRGFRSEEAQPGRAPVVVMGYGLWRQSFGGDPGIIGKSITVNGAPATVVGVMPQGFNFPDDSQMWSPLVLSADDLSPNNRGSHQYEVIARLKRSLSLDQARGDMQRVSAAIMEQNPQYDYKRADFTVLLVPLLDQTVGREVKTSLWVLMSAVGFVLLIVCVNLASLMLARASSRERETAIRMALGAGAWRLVRQFLTESVLLSFLGGAIGLALVPFVLAALIRIGETALPRTVATTVDWGMLAFSMGLSIGAGLLFGLLPALRAARGVQYETLKEGTRGNTSGPQSSRSLRILVAAEAAISLVLLVGAGLLLRSFVNLLHVDPGFRSENVLTVRVALSPRYADANSIRAFYRDVISRARALPGVEAAGAISALPLSGDGSSGTTTMDTQEVSADKTSAEIDWRVATPGYFEAMRIPLVAGRYFDEHDSETAAPVAIIDESLARTYWPHESAIGKRIHRGGMKSDSPWMTIVGVVKHVRYRTLEAESRNELYWPAAQRPTSNMGITVRSTLATGALAAELRDAVLAVDPQQPIFNIRTMDQLAAASMSRRRLALILIATFAALAMLLAALGIYGTTSYAVSQRYSEMGVRVAIGASPWQILRLVLAQGMSLTLAGLGAGLAGAFLLSRLIRTMLFSVKSSDPLTFIAAAVVLAAIALVACVIPARRAMRVDPLIALRYE